MLSFTSHKSLVQLGRSTVELQTNFTRLQKLAFNPPLLLFSDILLRSHGRDRVLEASDRVLRGLGDVLVRPHAVPGAAAPGNRRRRVSRT